MRGGLQLDLLIKIGEIAEGKADLRKRDDLS